MYTTTYEFMEYTRICKMEFPYVLLNIVRYFKYIYVSECVGAYKIHVTSLDLKKHNLINIFRSDYLCKKRSMSE